MDLFNQLVLSIDELKYLGYFVSRDNHYYGKKYENDSNCNSIYSIDCEMVETTLGREVILVGICKVFVNSPDVITDKMIFKIKPVGAVTNYISEITGCDQNIQYDMTYAEFIEYFEKLLSPTDILVGHHLYNDLITLDFYHINVIDTCMIFHHPNGMPYLWSLKTLAKKYLMKSIQNSIHDPIEDAWAACELVRYCYQRQINRIKWNKLSENFPISLDVILEGLESKILRDNICCVYHISGQTITYDEKIDMNRQRVIIVYEKQCSVMDYLYVKYGNFDMFIYFKELFEKYLKEQSLWALESIYNGSKILEKIDFSDFVENYRKNNKELCDEFLRHNVGFNASQKLLCAKKTFQNGKKTFSIEYVFCVFRIVEYGRQIVNYGKIINPCNADIKLQNINEYDDFNKYYESWKQSYTDIYRQFSKCLPKKKSIIMMSDHDTYVDYIKAVISHEKINKKNSDMKIHIIKIIQENEDLEFCESFPEYSDLLKTIKGEYNDFINKLIEMYSTAFEELNDKDASKKVFFDKIQRYNKVFHKYLYEIYDNRELISNNHKFLREIMKLMKPKKLYNDMFRETRSERKTVKYTPVPRDQWELYQINNSKKIITRDTFDISAVRYIAGLDISFHKKDDSIACAYITIYDVIDKQIVYEDYKMCSFTVPYVSGFLGFREVPEYIELLNKLKLNNPKYYPDVLMIDGFGILHYRGFGSASQIGFDVDVPCIGVAKTLLMIDNLDEREIKIKFRNQCKKVGEFIELIGSTRQVYGAALRTSLQVENPIYVSIGHKISLESAIKLVNDVSIYRIPEPLRNSDIKSKLYFV